MSQYLNIDCMDPERGLPSLPDGCASLVMVDPPYFKIKGKFDFIWPDFDAYLTDVEIWVKECARVMAPNGSLFWWGHAKKIAYSQIILDKYLTLENSCVWEKTDCRTRKNGPEMDRTFPPVTERCLFYSHGREPNEWQQTGWESVKLNTSNFGPLRAYFKEYQENLGTTKKAIIDQIGQCADHCFRWKSTQWGLPTPETYAELLKLPVFNGWKPKPYEELRQEYEELRQEYEELRQEYEELRQEYEELRRPFDSSKYRLFDVWHYSQESHATRKYGHDTQKPPKLIRALIEKTTRSGDLIVVPFGGSGVDGEQAILAGREFIGYEMDSDYCDIANRRVMEAVKMKAIADSQPTLF